MNSQDVKQLIDKHDSQRFGSDTPSNVMLRESNRAVARGSLLNALQTARLVDAVEALTELLRGAVNGTVCDYGVSETGQVPPAEIVDLNSERVSIPK